ncbi:hypothetical protein F5887DRAFT_1219234 [Amanita rubescens]|nr:hypothetical protein F5887DRAFT_1219234 [Amanita rubescens]
MARCLLRTFHDRHEYEKSFLTPRKRKANEAAIAASIQDVDLPDGWIQKLLALGPDLAYVLASLANARQITASQIKKARIGLPSFSCAKWSELAPNFDLRVDLTMARFDSFSIAPVLLPPSFHETTAEVAWRFQDVYRERPSQEREEVRVRVFDAVCPTVEEVP